MSDDAEMAESKATSSVVLHIHRKKRKKKNIQPSTQEESNTDTENESLQQQMDKLNNAYNAILKENKQLKELIQGMNEEQDMDFPPLTQDLQKKISHKDNKKDNNVKLTTAAKEQKKQRSPPPIIAYNLNIKAATAELKKVLNNTNFTLNVVNKNVTKISVCQPSDHPKVTQYLKTIKLNYFTYTPLELKPITLGINKLPLCYTEEEITEAIKALKINVTILKVIKTSFKWLLQVGRDSDLDEIKNVRYLLHCRVEIVDAKKRRLLQCKNCQRFSHSAVNCNMPYRCVKCCDTHGPGECKIPPKHLNTQEHVTTNPSTGVITKVIGIPIACVNCGTNGHTANAPSCPKRIEILNRSRERIIRNPAVSQHRQQGVSYATVAQSIDLSKESKENEMTQIPANINNDCEKFFGKNFYQCLKQIGEFKTSYTKLRNDELRAQALFNLFISLKIN